MADIKFVVTEEYGNVNSNGMKLRKVSWNDREAKFDLRSWYEKDGEERPNKGVTLTKDELLVLRNLINEICEADEKPKTKVKATTKAKSAACSARTTKATTKTSTSTSKPTAKAKATGKATVTKKGGKR